MGFTISKNEIASGTLAIALLAGEYPGVKRIAGYVAGDMEKVFGEKPEILKLQTAEDLVLPCEKAILVLSLDHASSGKAADRICKKAGVSVDAIRGKRECYLIKPVTLEGKEILLIAGSDKRGCIYGLFALSEKIGVTPFVNWLSIMPAKKEKFVFEDAMSVVSKEPSVRYRGFFINDEWPAFGTWVNEHFGGFNAKAYEGIFELLLRLKGNYLWPAMWTARFQDDGPGLANAELADEMGVVMGMSHHEPCLRQGEEYKYLRGKDSVYGDAWNFIKNREGITRFWEDGLKRSGKFENVITVGMRGEADSTILGEEATLKDNIDLLREVLKTQNRLIREQVNETLSEVPRMLALYKEVEPFFYGDETTEGLMGDPELDHVILMLCDDNFGNLRTVPTEEMRSHNGGYGMYYHFDYHGDPVSYEWVNSSSLYKTWEEMTTAYEFGIRQLWIVNVGDLFTQEYPLSFFLDLAYDFETWGTSNTDSPAQYTEALCRRVFGGFCDDTLVKQCAALLSDYTHIAHNRRPECINDDVYAPMAYRERERLTAACRSVVNRLEEMEKKIPKEAYNAFYQLIGYPAMANMNMQLLWLSATYNKYLASIGAAMANEVGKEVFACLRKDKQIVQQMHAFLDGKWNGMGLSRHIGFRNWNEEECRNPVVASIEPADKPRIICVVPETGDHTEGGDWTGKELVLPDFLRYDTDRAEIYLYNASDLEAPYEVTAEGAYITTGQKSGVVAKSGLDILEIRIDREKLADANNLTAAVRIKTVSGNIRVLIPVDTGDIPEADGESDIADKAGVTGKSNVEDHTDQKHAKNNVFIMSDGYVSMEAEHYADSLPGSSGSFRKLEGFGRTVSGMKAFPVDLTYQPGVDAPCLEYDFITGEGGEMEVTLITAPTNPPFRDNRILFSYRVNEGEIRQADMIPEGYSVTNHNKDWRRIALENARITAFTITGQKGLNRLLIYAQSPCFVPEKVIIRKKEKVLPYSCFGPPETKRINGR